MVQGRPRPRKTFTELLPVTFPMELSAVGSCCAASFDATVSGRLVPSATSVIAVMSSPMPMQQPRSVASSLTRAVTQPIISRAPTKQSHPPKKHGGGTTAKITFQGRAARWSTHSMTPAWACSSGPPPQKSALTNWLPHSPKCVLRVSQFMHLRTHCARQVAGREAMMTTSQNARVPSSSVIPPNLTPGLASERTMRKHSSPSRSWSWLIRTGTCTVFIISPSSKLTVPSQCS
mmetsp:Transcript_55927/g.173401  ORF Transcript_55927/g.173401 Transcript_55927/m.173401 type:complete len:233 (-) Transcript_55927:384-1082(-)